MAILNQRSAQIFLWNVLLRYRWFFILTLTIGVIGTAVFYRSTPKLYESTFSYRVGKMPYFLNGAIYLKDIQDANIIEQNLRSSYGDQQSYPDSFVNDVQVKQGKDSTIITVRSRSPNPENVQLFSASIAKTLQAKHLEVYNEGLLILQRYGKTVDSTLEKLEFFGSKKMTGSKGDTFVGSDGAALIQQGAFAEISILGLRLSEPTIVAQPSKPGTSVYPSFKKFIFLGLALSLFISFLVTFLAAFVHSLKIELQQNLQPTITNA